jgi:hypothetical protein
MTIYIALTDDWELRGNGTGRVEDLQLKPAIALMDLYDRLGIKSTFNVEVMQQLAFERYAGANETIRSGRDAWLEAVRLMVARGFDVQLHIHPQWMNAEFVDGWWKLSRRWNIADYSADEIREMFDAAIPYLEALIAPHRIVSFRGGSWGMGPPSRSIVAELARRGIRIDVSIVNGNYYDGDAIHLDYRNLDSPFFAYRPDADDIRRFPRSPENAAPLIEIPTQSVGRATLIKSMILNSPKSGFTPTVDGVMLLLRYPAGFLSRIRIYSQMRNAVRRVTGRNSVSAQPDFVIRDPFGFQGGRGTADVIFDLSSDLPLLVLQKMADICISRAAGARRALTVLVLENHTKDLQRTSDFDRIARLIGYIRKTYPDVEFGTLAEISRRPEASLC